MLIILKPVNPDTNLKSFYMRALNIRSRAQKLQIVYIKKPAALYTCLFLYLIKYFSQIFISVNQVSNFPL